MNSLSEVKIIYGHCIKNDDFLNNNFHESLICHYGALYKKNNQIIIDSALFRGVDEYNIIHSPVVNDFYFDNGNIRFGNYIWIGYIPDHFGHFIISILSRLWAVSLYPDHLLLAYCGESLNSILNTHYMVELLKIFDIDINRLVKINDGDILQNVYVPQPSFIENYSSHKIINEVYEKFSKYNTELNSKDFVYISRGKIYRGIFGIENENELEECLINLGIKVIHIENLSIEDQLNVWGKYSNFIGFSGSSFHLGSLLSNKLFIIINRNEFLSSNQYIIDQFSTNKCYHLFSNDLTFKHNDNFNLFCKINNAAKMANDIIEIIQKINHNEIKPTSVDRKHKSASRFLMQNDSIGEKISHYASATQSSTYNINEGKTRDAEGVLSGYLTGNYQCHTNLEQDPWIKLDLTKRSLINEIRIFNRNDSMETYERFKEYEILISDDDIKYVSVIKSNNTNKFQKKIGKDPIRILFSSDIFSKYIKIVSIGNNYLHLDQVEVFGYFV